MKTKVTEGDSHSPLPVLNEMTSVDKNKTKITSFSGLLSVNTQRVVLTSILVLIMLYYNCQLLRVSSVRLLCFYTFWGQCQPFILVQYLSVLFLSWPHLRTAHEIGKQSKYFSFNLVCIKMWRHTGDPLAWGILGCLGVHGRRCFGWSLDHEKLRVLSLSYREYPCDDISVKKDFHWWNLVETTAVINVSGVLKIWGNCNLIFPSYHLYPQYQFPMAAIINYYKLGA